MNSRVPPFPVPRTRTACSGESLTQGRSVQFNCCFVVSIFFFLLKLCNRKWHTGWIHMDDLSQVGVAPAIRVTLRESISVASAALLFRPCASGVLLTCFHYCPLSHCSFAYPSVFHPDNVFCALVTFIGCLSFLRAIRALQLLKLNTHSAFNQC